MVVVRYCYYWEMEGGWDVVGRNVLGKNGSRSVYVPGDETAIPTKNYYKTNRERITFQIGCDAVAHTRLSVEAQIIMNNRSIY